MNRERMPIKPIEPDDHARLVSVSEREAIAARIHQLLPGATIIRMGDTIQIDEEDNKGIIVIVAPGALELRHPTIIWDSQTPVPSTELWKRLTWDELQEDELAALVKAAKTARKRQFRKCRYCGERVPPEHRISKDVCHGCAAAYEGVVF